jgi:hypothetical protein
MVSADWIQKVATLVGPNDTEAAVGLLIILGVLSIPVYLILQVWFGYAWAGRWRIAALIPLAGAVIFTYLNFRPPAELTDPINALVLFAPLGSVYLVIAGIVHAVLGGAKAGTETAVAK